MALILCPAATSRSISAIAAGVSCDAEAVDVDVEATERAIVGEGVKTWGSGAWGRIDRSAAPMITTPTTTAAMTAPTAMMMSIRSV